MHEPLAGIDAPPERILIVKPSSLGDIIHALPVLAGLREAYPSAQISWLAGTSFAPLLEGHPLLHEVIPFDRAHYGRMWRRPDIFLEFLRFVAEVRRRRFDWIVDLQGLIRSGFLAWAGGAEKRVGFADAREFAWLFYTDRVRCPRGAVHAVDRNLAVARALGLMIDRPEFPLGLRPEEVVAARRLLERAARAALPEFTAVIPGARWESKRWPAERFAALVDRLHRGGAPPCVLFGSPDERVVASEVRARCRSAVVDMTGQTSLRELAALLSVASQVVCNDSGPMHLAAALGRPLVALFGPTDPRRIGPYSGAARVVQHAVPCAPCYRRVCPLRHHNCLKLLEPATVHEAVTSVRRGEPDAKAGA